MANEVKKILEHYLFRNGDNLAFSVYLFGVSQDECHEILRNWHPFERPDIYSTNENAIYGLEHFEYDAHRHGRKGSQSSKEQHSIKQSIEAEIREKFEHQDVVTSFRSMSSKANEEYYKSSFIKTFTEHYAKVEEYKKHIASELNISSKDISIWLIAEDMTPLGTYFICRNRLKQGLEPAFPIFFPEIEKLFLESAKIDGIIFADNCNKVLSLVKRATSSVEALKKYHHYRGEPLFFFEPKIASTAIKIFNVKK